MNDNSGEQSTDIPQILRVIFPELSREVLSDIFEGFIDLFGVLHDEYLKEHRQVTSAKSLDGIHDCDSLKRTL
ncbi:hypothetical protein [Rhodoferax sp. GW822-FHT02A01]|uniref:hypothetical protein n=1 Tax=Rhodoferax sp. GW822-FHT02A01 TaxID=3141537 RepID=UPI00315DF5D3